jgi:UDP-glucose 4-epimerase
MSVLRDCPLKERVQPHELRGQRWLITGGAGFIGSHLTDHLLGEAAANCVTLFDDFSSGRQWHYEQHANDPRLKVIRGDVADQAALRTAMAGHDVVIHLASNAKTGRTALDPDIDFRGGTLLTREVLEAMRLTGVSRILFASCGGVYGDLGELELNEDHGPLDPASPYTANKLASEALISAYCHTFGMTGCALRFDNVVGPRQWQGAGVDFVRHLIENPRRLRIPGNGLQNQSHLHVDDLVNAFLLAHERTETAYRVYNVAAGDAITVAEIARIAIDTLGIYSGLVELVYGGELSCYGESPRLDTQRIRALGWNCSRATADALRDSMLAHLADAQVARP